MNLCDPHRNPPPSVPSTGERPPFMPVKCDRCGNTHNLHGDCGIRATTEAESIVTVSENKRPRTEQLPGEPKFNSLHISHLPLKIEGQTIHLFVAILNGEAVGQIIAQKEENRCDLRMLYVAQKHRHMGIGSRLVSRAQIFAHNERCNSIEIAVHKGNMQARRFWIHRKFIDDNRPGLPPDYQCMAREI